MGLRGFGIGLALLTCATSAAYSADVYGRGPGSLKDTPFVEVPWSWGGFYGGIVGGYGSGKTMNRVTANGNNVHGDAHNDPDGWTLGGTVGYNYQVGSNWIVGGEADISFADVSGTEDYRIYDGHYWHGGWDGLLTLRGRLGYALGNNLVYGTGGFASLHSNELIAGNNANESDSGSGWRSGWVIGGGIEHAFTDRISGKVEYLHAEFEDLTGQTGFPGDMANQYYLLTSNLDLVRVGVNYKFN